MQRQYCRMPLGVPCLWSFILLLCAVLFIGTTAAPAQAAKAVDMLKGAAGLVDINNASQAELESIKGVGPATAKKIIAGRPYSSVNDLSKAGLSARAVEALKPYVTVGKAKAAATASDLKQTCMDTTKSTAASAAKKLAPGTKININTADKTTLESLPEIGPVKAQAIIDGRPYKTPEDIMKVKGIKQKTFDAIKGYIVVR
jgi:competence protein ComEA